MIRLKSGLTGCDKGNHCEYSHHNPNSIPFCPDYNSTNGCKYGSQCQYRHENFGCKSSNCYQINRMISALIFYSTINPIHDIKHTKKFLKYFTETYEGILDDYIHIMDGIHGHQNDLEQISIFQAYFI